MSDRTMLCNKILKAGYELKRANKHFVFKNRHGHKIIVPNHNKINKHTVKGILKSIQYPSPNKEAA